MQSRPCNLLSAAPTADERHEASLLLWCIVSLAVLLVRVDHRRGSTSAVDGQLRHRLQALLTLNGHVGRVVVAVRRKTVPVERIVGRSERMVGGVLGRLPPGGGKWRGGRDTNNGLVGGVGKSRSRLSGFPIRSELGYQNAKTHRGVELPGPPFRTRSARSPRYSFSARRVGWRATSAFCAVV